MQISKHFIIIFLIVILTYTKCMHRTKCTKNDTNTHCPTRTCNKSDPITQQVRFPFRIRNDSCGYTGFDLFCDDNDMLSIKIHTYGNFYVKAIDYINQKLWLNDPSNCLPKRLLSTNHSFDFANNCSPFVVVNELAHNLYNCSYDRVNSSLTNLNVIECLSGSKYGVVSIRNDTVDEEARMVTHMCDNIGTIRVPIGSESNYSDPNGDIQLVWNIPDCRDCFRRGGFCGFRSNSSIELGCFNLPRHKLARSVAIAIGFAIITPMATFFIVVTIFTIKSMRTTNEVSSIHLTPVAAIPPQQPPQVGGETTFRGLDRTIIESFPKIVLGENTFLPNVDDHMYMSCAICLNDYLPKETLRKIPPCGHFYHATCIDAWLLLNASCPICRNYSSSSHFSENSERSHDLI